MPAAISSRRVASSERLLMRLAATAPSERAILLTAPPSARSGASVSAVPEKLYTSSFVSRWRAWMRGSARALPTRAAVPAMRSNPIARNRYTCSSSDLDVDDSLDHERTRRDHDCRRDQQGLADPGGEQRVHVLRVHRGHEREQEDRDGREHPARQLALCGERRDQAPHRQALAHGL